MSRFDPLKHHRRTIRYANWDYRAPGYYFITICTHQRQLLFNVPANRRIAEARLQAIPHHKQMKHVALDQWVVMPNHVHLIIWLKTWPAGIMTEPEKKDGFSHAQRGSVGAIIGTYKSQVTRQINSINRQKGHKIWQLGYWDRIIRNETELNRTRQYIIDNPKRWQKDQNNLDTLLARMTHHP